METLEEVKRQIEVIQKAIEEKEIELSEILEIEDVIRKLPELPEDMQHEIDRNIPTYKQRLDIEISGLKRKKEVLEYNLKQFLSGAIKEIKPFGSLGELIPQEVVEQSKEKLRMWRAKFLKYRKRFPASYRSKTVPLPTKLIKLKRKMECDFVW